MEITNNTPETRQNATKMHFWCKMVTKYAVVSVLDILKKIRCGATMVVCTASRAPALCAFNYCEV